MNFQTIAETLAAQTNLSARTIVMIANVLAVPETILVDLRTPEARAQWVRTLPEARNAIEESRLITAIKIARDESRGAQYILPDSSNGSLGLKETKDAVEAGFSVEIAKYRAERLRTQGY